MGAFGVLGFRGVGSRGLGFRGVGFRSVGFGGLGFRVQVVELSWLRAEGLGSN